MLPETVLPVREADRDLYLRVIYMSRIYVRLNTLESRIRQEKNGRGKDRDGRTFSSS